MTKEQIDELHPRKIIARVSNEHKNSILIEDWAHDAIEAGYWKLVAEIERLKTPPDQSRAWTVVIQAAHRVPNGDAVDLIHQLSSDYCQMRDLVTELRQLIAKPQR